MTIQKTYSQNIFDDNANIPRDKNYTGALGDFAPNMQKRAFKTKKKSPWKLA